MEYKQFSAEIAFNRSAKRFDGVVLGASQEITFSGKSVSELETNFKASIDRHLSKCASKGTDPYKSYSGNIPLRFSDKTVHRDCALAAQKEGISLNKWIESVCVEKLRRSR